MPVWVGVGGENLVGRTFLLSPQGFLSVSSWHSAFAASAPRRLELLGRAVCGFKWESSPCFLPFVGGGTDQDGAGEGRTEEESEGRCRLLLHRLLLVDEPPPCSWVQQRPRAGGSLWAAWRRRLRGRCHRRGEPLRLYSGAWWSPGKGMEERNRGGQKERGRLSKERCKGEKSKSLQSHASLLRAPLCHAWHLHILWRVHPKNIPTPLHGWGGYPYNNTS